MHNIKFSLLLIALAAISIPVIACGSSNGEGSTSDMVAEPELDAIQMTLRDSVFTADDVVAAGWKKSKELSSESLPGATSVWYGFYQQRDVEVRVYESQDEAISLGQDLADTATGRNKPQLTSMQNGTRTSYISYAIVGNLILLCEIKIEDCQSLLDGIGH